MDAARVTEGGFTLLETLIAVVLLAFLTLGLAAALRIGLVFPALTASAGRAGPIGTVQHFLRRELSSALSLPSTEANTVAFAGGPHALEMVASMPARAGAPGLNEISLFLQRQRLMLRWRRLDPPDAPVEKQLLADVADLDIAYWGSPDGREPARWHDQWRTAAALPPLVRIRARLTGALGEWPDLLVALPTSRDPRVP